MCDDTECVLAFRINVAARRKRDVACAAETRGTLRQQTVRGVAHRHDTAGIGQHDVACRAIATDAAEEAGIAADNLDQPLRKLAEVGRRCAMVIDDAGQSAAAGHALCDDAVSEVAPCKDVAAVVQRNHSAVTAGTARSRKHHAQVGQAKNVVDNRDFGDRQVGRVDLERQGVTACTATTTDTLCNHAVRERAVGLNIRAIGNPNHATVAGRTAAATKDQRRFEANVADIRHVVRRVGADIELQRACLTAGTTAATNALRHDSCGEQTFGKNRVAARDEHVVAMTANATASADRNVERETRHRDQVLRARREVEVDTYGRRVAARATTTADALGEDRVGVVASRHDRATAVDIDNVAAAATATAAADCDRGAGIDIDVERHRRSVTAITAAAADTLRRDTAGAEAKCLDVTGVIDVDQATVAAQPATAADRDRCVKGNRYFGNNRSRSRERKRVAAATATTANALRKDPVRINALGEDAARVIDRDELADTAVSPIAAYCDADREVRAHGHRRGTAAITATATDALHEDAG